MSPALWLRLFAASIAITALPANSTSSRAEVTVEGSAAGLRIVAKQAHAHDVLVAIRNALSKQFAAPDGALGRLDAAIGRTIAGNVDLDHVLPRVLHRFNYVIKTQDGTVVVVVVGQAGDAPPRLEPSDSGASPNTNPSAQWRLK